MRPIDIPQFWSWANTSVFAHKSLWRRELSSITELSFTLFIADAGPEGRDAAIDALDRLQTSMVWAAMARIIGQEDMGPVAYELPVSRYALDDFLHGLKQLPVPRRTALLYALDAHVEPAQAAALKWVNMTAVPQHGLAADVIRHWAALRHIRLPYVFWEWATPHIASPMIGLTKAAEEAFSAPWPRIQARYQSIAWIDSVGDLAELRLLMGNSW